MTTRTTPNTMSKIAALNIVAERNSPAVSFNPEHCWFRIVGNSIPENAGAFYAPVVEWIRQHREQIPDGCVFEFSLPYFNSSSLKALYQVLQEIKMGIDQGKRFMVTWYVEEEDDFMLEAGETYRDMLGLDIDIKPGHIEI
jgi:hypothetical protein